jgi:CO/xanthine dehydrogenase FAD-binding subunit
MSTWE